MKKWTLAVVTVLTVVGTLSMAEAPKSLKDHSAVQSGATGNPQQGVVNPANGTQDPNVRLLEKINACLPDRNTLNTDPISKK